MASSVVFNEVQYLADSLKFFVNSKINLVKIIDKLEVMLMYVSKSKFFQIFHLGTFHFSSLKI